MTTYTIGIDVGGTNTDAVFLQTASANQAVTVVDKVKTPTTLDVVSGIQNALNQLLAKTSVKVVPKEEVRCVFLGTTAFLNALLECKNLLKVGIVRLCGPTTRNHPPLIEWPQTLKTTVLRGSWWASGGYEFFPEKEISPLDDRDFVAIADDLKGMDVADRPVEIIVSGVHAPLKIDQEQDACKRLRKALADKQLNIIRVTSSCEAVGCRIGILKRESAAVLNACLRKSASITVGAIDQAIKDAGLTGARAYLTTSDGTVVHGGAALDRPVECIASGPVNSIRGAGVLINDEESETIFVLDVGGTTTDVGVLVGSANKRHVRQSNSDSRVAGVRTNNYVADVVSIALGGGSEFMGTHFHSSSVGYQITTKAICCGGDTPTFTDVALACQSLLSTSSVNDAWCTVKREALRAALTAKTGASVEEMQAAYRAANQRVADLVSKLKTSQSSQGIKVILAGGGGALLDGDMLAEMLELPAGAVVKAEHMDVANACGAGLGQVGAVLDKTEEIREVDFDAKVEELRKEVCKLAVEKGGLPGTAVVIQEEVTAIAFVSGNTKRVFIKAVADLNPAFAGPATGPACPPCELASEPTPAGSDLPSSASKARLAGEHQDPPDMFSPPEASPKQLDEHGVWVLSEYDIHCLAIGCGILGCGGGGSTYKGFLSLKHQVRGGKQIRVLFPEQLPAHSFVQPAAFMGVPTVIEERIHVTGDLLPAAKRVLASVGGEASSTFLLSAEVGGCNGLEPLILQAQTGAFAGVVDGDLMGRAFPELQMQTLSIYGQSILPAALCDAHGNVLMLTRRAEGAAGAAGAAGEEGAGAEEAPFVREMFNAAGESEGSTEPWGWKAQGPFVSEAAFVESEMRCALMYDSNPFTATEAQVGGMGMVAGLAFRPFAAATFGEAAIPHTLSRARAIGDALLCATRSASPVMAVLQGVDSSARLLMEGKVVLVQSNSEGGFAAGSVEVCSESGQRVRVQFQNEYLRCSQLPGKVLAQVPDLICILDSENGCPVATEEVKYGLRVLVVALPAHARLCTDEAMRVIGPSGFKSLLPPVD